MNSGSIYSPNWSILFALLCKEVAGTAMFNPFNAPSQLLLSTDRLRLYLFVPPFLSNSTGIEGAQLMMVRLEGISIDIQGPEKLGEPRKYQLFENVHSSGNSPLSTTDTLLPGTDGSTVIIPMMLPVKDNRHGRLLILMGASSCGISPHSISATAWEFFPSPEATALNTIRVDNSTGKWNQLANRTWPGIAYWGRTFITNGLDRHPQVFLFGGLCASYHNHSVTNTKYFNTLESIYPDLASHPPPPQYPNPPIPHAGFTITLLGLQSFLTHQYVLIGGHNSDGFVGLDKLAVFSHRDQLSASVDGEQEGGWTYVRTFSSLSVHGFQHVDPRSGHASVLSADGKKVFVFGGWYRDVGDSGMAVAEPQVVALGIDTNPELGWVWKTSNLSILGTNNELKHKGLFGHSAILLDHEIILLAGGYLFTNGIENVERNTQVFMYNTSSDSWITTYGPIKTFAIPPFSPTPDANKSMSSSSARVRALAIISAVIATVFILCGVACFISWYRQKQKLKQNLGGLRCDPKSPGERGNPSEVSFPHSFGRTWSISSSAKSGSPFSFKGGEDVLSFFHLPALRDIYQPTPTRRERFRSFSPIPEVDDEDGDLLSRPDEMGMNNAFSPPTFPTRAASTGESISAMQKRDTNNEIDEWQHLVRNYWKHVDFVKRISRKSSGSFWTGSPVSTDMAPGVQTEVGNEAINSENDYGKKGIHDVAPPRRATSTSTVSSLSSKGSMLAKKISALLLPRRPSLTSPVPLSIIKTSNEQSVHEDMHEDYFPGFTLLADAIRSEQNINMEQTPVVSADTASLHTADTVSFRHSPINLDNITSSFYTQQQAIKSSHPRRPLPITPLQEESNWTKIQPAQRPGNLSNNFTAPIAVPGLFSPSKAHINSSSPPSSSIHSALISSQKINSTSLPPQKLRRSEILSSSVPTSTSPPAVSPVYSSSVYSSTHTALSEAERRNRRRSNSLSDSGGLEDDIHHFRRDPTRSGAHLNGVNSNQCSFVPPVCKGSAEEERYPRLVSTATVTGMHGDDDGGRGGGNKRAWERNKPQQKHDNNPPSSPPKAMTPTTRSRSFSGGSPGGYQPASRLLPKPHSLQGNDVPKPRKMVAFDTPPSEPVIGLGIGLDPVPGLFTKPNSRGSTDGVPKGRYRSVGQNHQYHGARNPPTTGNYVASMSTCVNNTPALMAPGTAAGRRRTPTPSSYMKREKQYDKEKNKVKEKEDDERDLDLEEEFKALRDRGGRGWLKGAK